jgi:hypothetical protein
MSAQPARLPFYGGFEVFEENVTEGIELTKFETGPDGKRVKVGTYWKLALHCYTCKVVFDECFCFSEKSQMVQAKKGDYYCSYKCLWAMMSEERRQNERERFRQYVRDEQTPYWIGEVLDMEPGGFDEIMMDYFQEELFEMDDGLCEDIGADLECHL